MYKRQVEELAAAQLETVGVSLDELKEKGIVELSDPGFEYKTPKFKTPTEKFQFSSEAVGEAGLNPVIGWTPRLVEPKQGEFYPVSYTHLPPWSRRRRLDPIFRKRARRFARG